MDDLLLRSSQPKPSYHRRPNLKFEECIIGGEKIKLPQALCENSELFQELFSVDSWNAFTEQQRRHLMQFLPSFGENEMEEKSYTLKLLFSGGEFRFGSNPLVEFGEKLNAGYYCSDIVNIQKLLRKARHKEYLKRQRVYYYKVLKHSLVMRHKLLESAKDLQCGIPLPRQPSTVDPVAVKRKIDRASLERRVKHRYYQELISIKKETGDTSDSSFDENYPEGFVPPPFTKKHRKQICQLEESFNAVFDQPVISTLSRPDCLDLSRLVLNVDNPFDMTEDKYKEMLKQFNRHHKNLHPYIKVQNRNNSEKSASASRKPPKEAKPMRKRRARKTPAAAKGSLKKPAESPIKLETTPLTDAFSNTPLNTFKFPELNPLEKKFEPMPLLIKQERLEDITISCEVVKPDQLLLNQKMTLKQEMAMKEEQDQAVAALLKQEDSDVDASVYIKTEDDKSSVLLFQEFDPRANDKEEQDTKHTSSSKYLLTPKSYNVALQSVVTNTNPSFKKTTVVEAKKSTPLPTVPLPVPIPIPIISQVENIQFDPVSIDTIADTPFTSSPPTISAVLASGNAPTMATISPSMTDLDSMNVMDLGPLNAEDTEPPPSREKPPAELIHNAHSSFFSLIREIVCSTWDHRMDLRNLQKRIDTWYDNAVSPLNSWYGNESWPSLLQNAVTFLAGQCPEDLLPPEYVPYIEYKSNLDIYQWIGAGRDSDAKLTLLCDTWLKNKDEVAGRVMEDESILPFVLHEDFEFKREQRAVSPAASRFPTDWVVQPSTKEEMAEFQKQEKLRFQNPNTPFAYRIHGYQTVVGPVNMNYAIPNSNKISKGSSLLVESRPYYVTILALVQDACARLPNGEGTRQDIVTLLKDSQYLSQNIINCVLHGAVTSSLERLQLESDPCIKYDARRKTWIYLHRSRTMNDFEMMEAVKPKTARKAAVWKLRRDYNPAAVAAPTNTTPTKEGTTGRSIKEPKVNVRAIKNLSGVKAATTADAKAMAVKPLTARNTLAAAKTETKVNNLQAQPTIIQAVIQDSSANKNTTELANVQTLSLEKARAQLLKAVDFKGMTKTVAKSPRPSIIKKPVVREPTPTTSAIATNVGNTNILDTKSILTSKNLLSGNTIVKLINAKSWKSSDTVKGGKTIGQISPQQIVVIKQPDDGTSSPDKKHTILLKQLQQHTQNQQHLSLANLKCQQRIVTSDQRSSLSTTTATSESRVGDFITTTTTTTPATTTTRVIEPHHTLAKRDSLLKQKQLHQLLVKHRNDVKLQQSGVKELQTITLQQSKVLPKQMIVVKPNQGQIMAETQSVTGEEEANDGSGSAQKQVISPLVILNKQQYQQQLQNSGKHQIIQLASGQQVTTQQIQQMLLKQQQQQLMKRTQQQQQIVMLKPDLQASAGQQQQIVMLKPQLAQPQQQLVIIKQSTMGQQQTQQKIQQKQPQTQVIQIANSAGLMTPITTDLSKVSVSGTTPRMQKIPVSAATMITQNTKTVNAAGTAISVSVSKPTMPTYTVVAVGQQQKVFPQNNQHLQILTSTSNTVNSNQTVVLPTNSGGLTLLQQSPMQQVLLPTGFNSSGMINLKTLQGLKVIPISTQSTGSLRGQPVITRLVNSSAVRSVLIQDDCSAPTSGNSTNLN